MADQPRYDGGPAYPLPVTCTPAGDVIYPDQYGMSLRDYFAAQALAGMTADPTLNLRDPHWRMVTAVVCYHMADAMLSARKA